MQYQRGFTIAELMIVIIIAAILAAFAAPNMSEFIKNNSRAARVNTMVTALTFARGQAVTRSTRVTLCRSADLAQCDAAGDGSFEGGWIVFVDGSTRGTVDGNDDTDPLTPFPLRVFKPEIPDTVSLVAFNDDDFIAGLSFESNGLGVDLDPASGNNPVTVGTYFVYCDDRGVGDARAIRISASGSPSLVKDIADEGLVCP